MKKLLLTSIAVSAFACGAAFASGAMAPVAPAHPGGWVLGLDGGYGQLSTLQSNLWDDFYTLSSDETESQSHEIGDFVWGAHVGWETNATDNLLLGLELGYKDLGDSKYDSHYTWNNGAGVESWHIKVEQQAVDLLLTGKYFIYEGLNVVAKAGFAYEEATTKQDYSDTGDPSENYSKSFWQLEPEVELGFGYAINQNWDVHVMYDYIHGTDGNINNNNDYTVFDEDFKHTRAYESNSVLLGVSYTIN